ncbi:MAG: transcription termination/antitermination protein NusA [Candidatus Omnitrophica bacterium]|nr:transcription termination/antitermination protein NusA [Candidatus Omnitrophota bacterium]
METNELIGILEQLERDKGINKDVLIKAVEAAVASAAKKLWTVGKEEDIRVVLDPKTGKLTAFAGTEEIRSSEFGRIAAQTAKQVVIQKIREAEKDVIFTEFQERMGQIISGSVYRFDKGSIIVDLGKAEACIPKKEQSPKEEFKQGDRIRAYVLDVGRENRGSQVILSRAHPNFIKRLFEMEVPEIYEGIVEIKAISRDVGQRTKIAVYSKDEKVDCVGACVGMRGTRVKNIVSEIQGEKIDIIRYSSDIKEYIQAALSPAEISQIQIGYEEKKANIIVADDQLSLAIGKNGQNVRLASQLVGWDLDLYSFDQWKKMQDEIEAEEKEDSLEKPLDLGEKVEKASGVFAEVSSISLKVAEELNKEGFDSLEKLSKASLEDLTKIKGLGKIKAQKIIDEVQGLLNKNTGA